jgi:A/G-specific adenine glycosylase
MLLRKTRAASVQAVIERFLAEYPDPVALAGADTRALERLLQPLGLHRIRARALKKVASSLITSHRGEVPRSEEALLRLPHVGKYAANAVLCFSFGLRRPIVDANVVRIDSRVFGVSVPGEVHRADALWAFAGRLLPRVRFGEFNMALLDLGGVVCTARHASCALCPLRRLCQSHLSGSCGCDERCTPTKGAPRSRSGGSRA